MRDYTGSDEGGYKVSMKASWGEGRGGWSPTKQLNLNIYSTSYFVFQQLKNKCVHLSQRIKTTTIS